MGVSEGRQHVHSHLPWRKKFTTSVTRKKNPSEAQISKSAPCMRFWGSNMQRGGRPGPRAWLGQCDPRPTTLPHDRHMPGSIRTCDGCCQCGETSNSLVLLRGRGVWWVWWWLGHLSAPPHTLLHSTIMGGQAPKTCLLSKSQFWSNTSLQLKM